MSKRTDIIEQTIRYHLRNRDKDLKGSILKLLKYNDYVINGKQYYTDGTFILKFSKVQETPYTIWADDADDYCYFDFEEHLNDFRTNSLRVTPPSLEELKALIKENDRYFTTVAIYLGNKEVSAESRETVVFSADRMRKVLECMPKSEMYLFSNFTPGYNEIYGTAYLKNAKGDEAILLPITNEKPSPTKVWDNEPLWTYEKFSKFRKAE